MAWNAPKIQALLLKVAPAKAAANLPVRALSAGVHAPSPRQFAVQSKSSYGGK